MSKQLILKGLLAGANLAYNAYRGTRTTPVHTMAMPPRRYASKRMPIRRRPYVPRNIPRVKSDNAYLKIKRTAPIASAIALSAGFSNGFLDVTLNQFDTTDLVGIYDVYRIKSVTAEFLPVVDFGNSGIVDNQQMHVYAANDTVGTSGAPATTGVVTRFANYKYGSITSGSKFLYTFYPKATNTVDNAGTAVGVGSYGTNPWIALTTAGINIPHHRLLYFAAIETSSTQKFRITFTVTLEVKRMR
jgi:hypothetical protein